MGRLEGKVAVITGAASGIGRGTVDLFVKEGAKVIAADIQDDKGARLEETHGKALRYIRCDVTKEEDVKAAIDLAKSAFGKLDCVFNNAGTATMGESAELVTAESFDAVMHLHVRAAMFGIKHAAPIMRAQGGGSIISTASIAGLQLGYGPYLYSVAKAAIKHMTTIAAGELGPSNIRVNCICPGFIATPIFARAIGLATQVADQRFRALLTSPSTRSRFRKRYAGRHRRSCALPRVRRFELRHRASANSRWRHDARPRNRSGERV